MGERLEDDGVQHFLALKLGDFQDAQDVRIFVKAVRHRDCCETPSINGW